MFQYIENLKTKPEHVRRKHAFAISFSFTMIVFVGWIASYTLDSSPILTQKDENGKTVVEAPVSSMSASIIGAYNDVKNIIFNSNKVEYNSIEITAGKM